MTTPPSRTSPQSTTPLPQHQQNVVNHGSGNTKIVAGYALQQRLGSGSFATVYRGVKVASARGQTDSSSTVAVKAINRSSEKLTKKVLENLEMEISILRTYRHPNIVCLHDVQKTERHFYLILEFCAGGDVQRLIRTRKTGRITERLTRRLVRDLSAGLKFLWGQELIHRDIKPQNLLLTGPLPLDEIHDVSKNALDEEMRHKIDFPSSKFALKIADFGFARHLQTQSLAETLCGSPLYMAPEILQHQRYDAKADIWSVGTVVFEMIAGRPPFHGENHIDLLRNIQRKAVRLPPDVRVSKECVNLLRILLNRNPLSRAGFKEFFEAADAFVALGCEGAALAVDVQETYQPPSGMELGIITETEHSIHGTESMATIATAAMPQHTIEFRSRQPPKEQTPSRLVSNSLQQTEHHNNQHRKISPSPYTPAQQMPYEDTSGASSDKSNIAVKPVTPPFGPITVTSQPPIPTTRDHSNAEYNHADPHNIANGPRQYPHFVPLEPSPPGPTATKTLGQTNTAFPPPLSLGSADGPMVRQPAPSVPRLNAGQQQLLPSESSHCVMARSPFQQTTAQQYEMKDQYRHRRTGSSQNSDDSEFVIVEHGNNNSSGSLSPSASKARLSIPGNKQGQIQQPKTQALIWNQLQSGQRKLGTGSRLAPSPPASPMRNPDFSEGNVTVASAQRVGGGVQQTTNPRLIKGMLSTSPGTGGALVGMMEAHSIGGVGNGGNLIGSASGNLRPGSSLSIFEAAAKILAAAEDVGRRAVNVAHLGDTRAYVAMRLIMSEGGSSLLSTTPMEGVEEEDADNGCTDSEFTSSTSIPIAATGRRRTISADRCGNASRGQMEAKDDVDDDDDEMPFAIFSPDVVPIPSSPSTFFRPSEPARQSTNPVTPKVNVCIPLSSIQSHFHEALSCYLKALSMIKSAVNAARTVHAELSRPFPPAQQSLDKNDHNAMLLERCQVSLCWLKAQFAGVLERADAANGEVGKVQSSDSNEPMDNLQLVSVEELVYKHALTCGRDGAVKQLLGQHEAARACYRSAGLLAETLLMEPKLGEDDRKVLEDYVHGFAERITELDDIMFQKSRQGGSTIGSRRGSGVIGLVGPSNGSTMCVDSSAEKHYI